jgi:exopolyphosphatase/guanosine-5'-triphosphate,3'-diphosphate pyrophosphatase
MPELSSPAASPIFKAPNAHPMRRVAAIDLGTNSFHVILADLYADGHFEIVDTLKEMVLLGEEGMADELSSAAMDRGIEALRKIRSLCDGQGVERILAYATSAIREARNGGVFIQRAIDEVGIKINAISGLLEAELIGYGVQHGVSIGPRDHLMVDIGGGSVEFIIGDQDVFSHLESLKIGVARLASRFVAGDPIDEKAARAIREHVIRETESVSQAWGTRDCRTLIGSSGTFQSIAMMIAIRRGGAVPVTINEFEFTRAELDRLKRDVLGMKRKRRLLIPGMDEKRVDLIQTGLVLVDTLMDRFGMERVKISSQALREGILIRYLRKMLKRDPDVPLTDDPRRRSIMELAYRCNWHETHSRHVCGLSMQLFEALRDALGLTDADRDLLEYAALLHDIGYHISHHNHHKHALYLIQNADLRGFSEDEIQIMGHIARYHRRSMPKRSHEMFHALPKAVRARIRKLAGILRVADGLDRSHYQNVSSLTTSLTSEALDISLSTQSDPALEIWGAERKSDLLQEELGRPVRIAVQPQ